MKKIKVLLLAGLLLLLSACGQQKAATVLLPADMPAWEEAEPEDAETSEKDDVKYAALTFDDGPSQYTESLLNGLKARGINATFFLIGEQIQGREDLVRRMRDEGHQIGNHSYDHPMLNKVNSADAWQNLNRCDTVLREVLGEGSYWIRPPYGLITETEMKQAPVPLIYWSVDTLDWKLRNTKKVLAHILNDTQDGSIILMHDCYETSVEAALKGADVLKEQGYELVTLEELFAIKGIEPQNGALYRSVK